MKYKLRAFWWDVVMVVAVAGVIYGTWEMIEAKGWGIGLPLAVVTVILGALAMQILGPLWFGRRW